MGLTVLDELTALGIRCSIDSLGVMWHAPAGTITRSVINEYRARRFEIHAALLAQMRAVSPPPSPALRGTARCHDCGTPSGSAYRCAPCATRSATSASTRKLRSAA